MKKIMMMVAVALMTAMNVNAQNENLRNELSLSYGVGSLAQFGDGLGEGIGLIFSNKEYDDGFILGPISMEYFHHFNNPRLAVGGLLTYSKWDSDVLNRSSHEKVGEIKRNFFSVMPSIKYYWINKNNFGLYSKAALGTSKDETNTYFMFQASFIGAEFGGKFRGFVELGVGDQGFLQAGVRYKF